MKDIRQAQKENPLCKRVYEHLDGVQLADPKKDHEIMWNTKNLTIDQGILMRPPRPGALGRNRPYLPPGELRKRVVHFFHEDLTAVHQSVKSTLEQIQATYWWDEKAMKDAIEKHVLGCPSRSYNKVRGKKLATGLQPMPISGPW